MVASQRPWRIINLRRTNVLTQDSANPGFQVQVGEQASDGVELDIAGELVPGWNVIANYAYYRCSHH